MLRVLLCFFPFTQRFAEVIIWTMAEILTDRFAASWTEGLP
jgi:hypothetical protein